MDDLPRDRGAETDPVVRAERAVWLSATDPELAESEARALLAEAESVPSGEGDAGRARAASDARYAEAVPVALRAAALAARELGDIDLAVERLERAVTSGAGFPNRVAQARMSLVTMVAELGDPERGLRLAGLAERDLAGADLARLGVQRSAALILLGRFRDAVRHCDEALGGLDGDPRFHAGGLLNRGVARTYLEEYERAEADLSACARIARKAGLGHLAMLAEGNLPFVAARRGDISGAFERFRTAETTLFGFPERLAAMRTDFAYALVAARLLGEARTLLERAVPDLAASGAQAGLADARLLLAQVELLTGAAADAHASAEAARSELLRQGRTARVPLATEVVLRARLARERPTRELLGEMLACARDLDVGGAFSDAAALRLTAAEAALGIGDRRTALDQLGLLAGSTARTAVRQHALAVLRHLGGDLPGALSAARAGVAAALAGPGAGRGVPEGAAVGETADPAGTPPVEARAYAARTAENLARFCLRLALESGDPWTVLTCSERLRALARDGLNGTGHTSEGDPASGEMSPDGLPGRMGQASGETPCDGLPGGTRHGAEGEVPRDGLPVEPEASWGSLIELVRDGEDLAAVLVTAGRRVLRPLGSYAAAAEATVRGRYALRRRNLRDVQVESGLERDLATLDEALLGPLGVPAGPVTIVPTGALHTLPWPLLPSLRGRPVSVAPSATSWFGGRKAAAATRDPVVVAVAGPGLEHAEAEADAVVRAHPGAVRVAATRAEVLAALGRADVLHVAAHGTFSPRGPLLSRITLDDGPLMAYDLIRLDRAPSLVILSACDAGMAHAPVDGAVLGLAGAFLARGARCVIAGVVPVRDDEALALMTVFHPYLREGRTPAEALALAARATDVAGFVCFGAGDRPLTAGQRTAGAS
ncbi:CHAT domain-containing protein [Microtetraspora niveoalba]|uniref:CHAT domain-containing protein n=1 Tax=Microtetraspora niveoalba TaxID=46175 RepID=UPI001470DE65|nr:CHAT domain-containing tetratricopeptide repeat protein [Microtetraspora niveoalba]